jgi:hypothetical protein
MVNKKLSFTFFLLIFSCGGYCKESIKTLQSLHRKMGSELIEIKKKYPESQMSIYSLLDQLSQYYGFSKKSIEKKNKYKKLYKTESEKNFTLTKNSVVMERKLAEMKKTVLLVGNKFKSDVASVTKLKDERDLLAQEKEKWLAEKKTLSKELSTVKNERDVLIKERKSYGLSTTSASAPKSPR